MSAKEITGKHFHDHVSATFDAARNNPAGVIVTAFGRPQVAVVSATEYERLLEERRVLTERTAVKDEEAVNGK